MSNPLDVQEFLAGFLAEADEHLRTAAQNMLALDQSLARGDSNPRAVRSLFRSLHTIKGLSAMVGADPIVDVAHAMENVLRAADRAPGSLGRGALEPLLQGLRRIEAGVAALAGGKPLAPAPSALLESLAAVQPAAAGSAASGTPRPTGSNFSRGFARAAKRCVPTSSLRRLARPRELPSPAHESVSPGSPTS